MTIFIDAEIISTLTSYSGLVDAIGEYLDRDDLVSRAGDFIRLAEARLRRIIVNIDMETQLALTPAATVSLPADFDSFRSLYIPGNPRRDITQVTLADFYARPNDYQGQPSVFAIVGSSFIFSPTPDANYPAFLTYRANIPSLGPDQQSNWLLTKHPDIYLYASLIQAEFYGWNDDRIALIKAALDEALEELVQQGIRKRYGSGPLVAKPAVSEGVRGAYR